MAFTNEQLKHRETKKLPQSYTPRKVADLTLQLSLTPEPMLFTTKLHGETLYWILEKGTLCKLVLKTCACKKKKKANTYLNSE